MMDVMEAKRAAVAGVLARQKKPKTVPAKAGGQDVERQTAGGPGTYEDPDNVDQWLLACVARLPLRPGDPVSEAAVRIAEGMRAGDKATRAAVSEARSLSEHEQYQLLGWLGTWAEQKPPAQASHLLRLVQGEWARLRMPAGRPELIEAGPGVTKNKDELAASDARRRAGRGW